MRRIKYTARFDRDLKKIQRSGSRRMLLDLNAVILLLADDSPLPEKYRDHSLKGKWESVRDCHIRPDLLLLYQKPQNDLVLLRIGSHSELFG